MYFEQIEHTCHCRHVNDTSTLYWKHDIIQNEESNSEQSDHYGEVASEAETNGQPAKQSSQVPIKICRVP